MRKNNAAGIFLGRFVIVRVSVVVCGNTVNLLQNNSLGTA